ncbi:MAG: T9SS type A sorting domain-containing protein [Candidatus Kapabacteria bacterium]|nr:T9SS type A sorting domain-containing protein [Candidatus Kapabacteria bacterium]
MKVTTLFANAALCASLLATTATAGTPAGEIAITPKRDANPISGTITGIRKQIPTTIHNGKSAPSLQSANFKVIDSLFNAFSYYGDTQRPLVWDPVSNTLATMTRGAFPFDNTPAGQERNTSNSVKIKTSNDAGATWNPSIPVYTGNTTIGNPRYPTLDIKNPGGKETDRTLLSFPFFTPMTKGTAGATWEGATVGVQENNAATTYFGSTLEGHDPKDGNSVKRFGSDAGVAINNTNPNGSIVVFSSTLSNQNNSGRGPETNSDIGLIRFDLESGDQNTLVPPPLGYATFTANTAANTRTNNLVGNSVHNGVMYVCAFGSIVAAADGAENTVTFGVTRSSDNGTTWSTMNPLMTSTIRAFATSLGWSPDSSSFRYSFPLRRGGVADDFGTSFVNDSTVSSGKDFIVYGDNQYSCIGIFYDTRAGRAGLNARLVEAKYDGSAWTLVDLGEYSLFETLNFYNKFLSGTSGVYNWQASQKGNETQLALTADGKTLVLKMLDVRRDIFPNGIGRKNEAGDVVAPDTVLSTDVVMATRPVSGGQWSKFRNLTNTTMIDRITWIPPVVPNDLKIPLLTVSSAATGATRYETEYGNQYRLATDLAGDYEAYKQYTRYALVDFNTAQEYTVDGIVSVDESVNTSPIVVEAAPNPAVDNVTVAFRGTESGNASVTITNSVGSVLYSAVAQATETGMNYHLVSTASLPSGSYYLNVRQGAHTTTKLINIIR